MASEGDQFHFHPETYLDMITAEVPGYGELQAQVVRATADRPAARILELGVGTGETSVRILAQHPAASLVGIDESDAMLSRAREVIAGADLRVQRLEDPLPEGTYDLVVSAMTIHHLDGPGKADLFGRIADVLRPGGRLVVGDVVIPEDPSDVVAPIEEGYDKPSRVDEQLRWMAEAGFEAVVTWSDRDLAVMVGDRRPALS
ncbi:MAG TPA: class I SAM-dependent methyltransferase [Acidimicrobiales bacterium]|nr:class I SAM-dependent methyltransferase [Acidimicrobiales bacterium]